MKPPFRHQSLLVGARFREVDCHRSPARYRRRRPGVDVDGILATDNDEDLLVVVTALAVKAGGIARPPLHTRW